jgi:hypothetical protein
MLDCPAFCRKAMAGAKLGKPRASKVKNTRFKKLKM